jgi:multiple antibiotic resistance protein
MLEEILILIGATIATLLPIANPFSTAPVFATLSKRFSVKRRKQQARMAAINMSIVLLVTLFAGALILTFFGITVPVMRIAGGILIARVGLGMSNPEPEEIVSDESKREARQMDDISFTPIAMPLLSGPGSIAVTISMATHADRVSEYLAVAIGIICVAAISLVILRLAEPVVEFLGVTGMNALTRVMGFLLICIGVQFVLTGLLEGITSGEAMGAIIDAIRQASG